MSAATITTAIAVVTALALLVEKLTGVFTARRTARRTAVEPAQVIASAAATIAASVDDIIAPLRFEVAALRAANAELAAEVRALRETLNAHGIAAPKGPFTTR